MKFPSIASGIAAAVAVVFASRQSGRARAAAQEAAALDLKRGAVVQRIDQVEGAARDTAAKLARIASEGVKPAGAAPPPEERQIQFSQLVARHQREFSDYASEHGITPAQLEEISRISANATLDLQEIIHAPGAADDPDAQERIDQVQARADREREAVLGAEAAGALQQFAISRSVIGRAFQLQLEPLFLAGSSGLTPEQAAQLTAILVRTGSSVSATAGLQIDPAAVEQASTFLQPEQLSILRQAAHIHGAAEPAPEIILRYREERAAQK